MLSSALAIGSAPAAQVIEPHDSFVPEERRLAWPVGVGSGTFGRSIIGKLTSDGGGSVILRRGSDLCVVFEPGAYSSVKDTGYDCNDMAILPGGAGGGRDAIVFVGGTTLEILTVDPTDGELDHSIINDTTWGAAKLVRCADLDGANGIDIFGVAADGQTVLRSMANGSGGYSSAASFDNGYTIDDIYPANWDNSGALEYAVLDSQGMKILTYTGVLQDSEATYQNGNSMVVLHGTGGAADKVCWVTKESSGSN